VITKVYFPNRAIISLVALMENGSLTEIGLADRRGMLGVPVFLGGKQANNQAIVQIADSAMQMDSAQLNTEFNRGGALQRLLLLYTQALLTQVSQTAACNRLHSLEERLARWLLLIRDSLKSNELPLTQEFISQMLGTRRSGVTVAAGTLQQAGIIRYTRGKITILNREDLEATSCECYCLVKDELTRLLGFDRG
jgi:CRP-like cAMP-binding protein